MAPPLVQRPHLGAPVERDQQHPGRPQHPPDLLEGGPQLVGFEVDHRVERHRGGELPVGGGQRQQVADPELRPGVLPPGEGHHRGRQVHPDRRRPAPAQPAGDVPRPAPQVRHRPPGGLLQHHPEQRPVHHLERQLAPDPLPVLLRHRVVARPHPPVHTVVAHPGSLARGPAPRGRTAAEPGGRTRQPPPGVGGGCDDARAGDRAERVGQTAAGSGVLAAGAAAGRWRISR